MTRRIYWLASYARSGNTWVRFLLHNYFVGRPGSSDEVAAFVPDLHVPGQIESRLAKAAQGERIFAKTHYPWSDSHPHAEATTGAIVLIRHPRDVLLSCLNFHKVMGTKAAGRGVTGGRIEDARYARAFLSVMGDPIWREQGHGSWPDNVRSWLAFDAARRLIVRYEGLVADPGASFKDILRFLGEDTIDQDRLAAAIEASSFFQLRALEVREKSTRKSKSEVFGGSGRTLKQGYYFMRKGEVGGSLDRIEPGLDAAFESRFADALRETGYAPRG